MHYTIILNEEDLLAKQLFAASKSKEVNKNRRKSVFWTFASLCFTALLFIDTANGIYAIALFIVAVAYLIFMPYYLKSAYRKYYLQHVRESYSRSYGMSSDIILSDDIISINELAMESRIKTSELSEINETGQYFFMRFKSSQTIGIPKKDIDTAQFMADIREIQKSHDFKITPQLDWKWK